MAAADVSAYKATYIFTLVSLLVAVALNGKQLVQGHRTSIVSVDLAVNLIASAFYTLILALWSRPCQSVRVRVLRYMDWALTLPLLALILFRLRGEKSDVSMRQLGILFFLVCMVVSGFIGTDRVDGWFVCGFVFFALAMWYLRKDLLLRKGEDEQNEKKRKRLKALYYATAALWSAYGVCYLVPAVKARNIVYNVLDFLSKSTFAYLLTAGFF